MTTIALLAALLAALPALPRAATLAELEGTVLWRDDFRPPPGARIFVRLVDISSEPGRLRTLGSMTILAGQQRSHVFRISYDAALAPSGRDYRVVAEMRFAGNLVMRNERAVPVLSGGPDAPEIVLRRFTVGRGEGSPIGREWRADTLYGEPVPRWARVWLRFDEDNALHGSTGCNRVSAEIELGEETLEFDDITVGRRSCRTEQRLLQSRVQRALAAVRGWRLEETRLRLTDAAGLSVIELELEY